MEDRNGCENLKLDAMVLFSPLRTESTASHASTIGDVENQAGGNEKATHIPSGEDINKEAATSERDFCRLSWPAWTSENILKFSDYVGTAVFCVTGTLTAADSGMNLLGCTVVGATTAIGGGTIRDMLLAHENGKPKRAFWMEQVEYFWICVVTCVLTFFGWSHWSETMNLSDKDMWIFYADSFALGVFACTGSLTGRNAQLNIALSAMCGMVTATFGGLIRDVVCQRPARILHSEMESYAATALGGAVVFLLVGAKAKDRLALQAVAGVLTTIALRTLAWTYDIRLPEMHGIGND